MNRVAILGAGIGAQHLAGFADCPDAWEVALIVDRDLDRARDLANGLPVAAEIEDALNDPTIDVIDICLPPHLHVPVALMALGAGKHVICEKPLATSLDHIDALAKTRAETGQEIFPIFQYRFGPAFTALRALQSAGLTGACMIASAETHWARDAAYYAVDWRGTWVGEQGGAVLGHAIHAHDLISHFAGAIEEVSARITTRANPIETEDCAALSFFLDGGALATSSITLGAATDETRLRFVFDRLTATSGTNPYAPGQDDWTFIARNPADQPAVDACVAACPDERSGFAGAFSEIANALSGAANTAVTFEDGVRSIELVTAIYAAARSGTPVSLPLRPDHPMRKGWLP